MTRITLYTWRHKLKTCKCFTCFAWFGVWNNPAYFWAVAPFNSSPVSVPPPFKADYEKLLTAEGDFCDHSCVIQMTIQGISALTETSAYADLMKLWPCFTITHHYESARMACVCVLFFDKYMNNRKIRKLEKSLKDVKWRGNVSSKRSYTVKWSRFKCCKLREWNLNPNYKTKYQSSLSQSQKTHLFVLCVKTCKASLKYGHLPRFK